MSTHERKRSNADRTDSDEPTHTDDRADIELPVTGEVGSEGGSFADPTYQVSQFEGDLGRTAEAAEPADSRESEPPQTIKPPSE